MQLSLCELGATLALLKRRDFGLAEEARLLEERGFPLNTNPCCARVATCPAELKGHLSFGVRILRCI